jgi:hypothetical protein
MHQHSELSQTITISYAFCGINLHYIVGMVVVEADMLNLPFQDQSFDVVIEKNRNGSYFQGFTLKSYLKMFGWC